VGRRHDRWNRPDAASGRRSDTTPDDLRRPKTITSALLVDDIERLLAGDATAFARLEPVGLVDHPNAPGGGDNC